MSDKKRDLFTPVRLGPYELPNRIVMAPMTRSRAGTGGVPPDMAATYYAQRASAGLIVTEAAQVSPQGVGYAFTPGIHSREQVEGWRRLVEAVHGKASRIFIQLFHAGRISHPDLQEGGAVPVAPSAIKPEGEAFTSGGFKPFVAPRALETEEIPGVIEQFRKAAECALEAGFDGVELHAANGYLPCQFLEDGTNRRADRYGGSPKNRARFVLEAVDAMSAVWGGERVGVHLSPGNPFNSMHDSDPAETYGCVVNGLNRFGLAYLSVVEIDLDNPGGYQAGLNDVTRRLRSACGGPYITNGGYDRESGTAVLASGDADLVSYGRLFLANPDLPERFRRNASLNTPDESTFYGGDEKGYTDYLSLEEERKGGEAP
jgi:N-ethylmaleimide reductase